jgi:hypothetical protein
MIHQGMPFVPLTRPDDRPRSKFQGLVVDLELFVSEHLERGYLIKLKTKCVTK